MTPKAHKTPETQLIQTALAALEAGVGIAHTQLKTDARYVGVGKQVDGYVWFQEPLGRYVIEAKRNLPLPRVGAVIAQLKALPLADPRLLVTDHVTPQVGEALKVQGIQFIDTAGNAYLHCDEPLVHIWAIGNKPVWQPAHEPVTIFRARGLRVIFPLLCLPDAVNAPYRQIAAWADVALGTVANTMEELERLGYLRKTRTERVIEDRAGLMQRWVEAYPQELRPRLKPQRFDVLYDLWWKEFPRDRFERNHLWLGGEGAAELLTRYLRAERITVYGQPNFDKLAREIKPARTDTGRLELLQPFWAYEVPDFDPECAAHRFCPPLLIYADLVATGEARQLDAAKLIKEKYLGDA